MPKGIIICTSSNLYQVDVNQTIYNCLARGKFKKDKIAPLPGDSAQITITDEVKKEGVLEQILPRKNELKRPKMANLTQLIFVVSTKMPSPDLLLLDKQLAFSKKLNINSIICFNKVDLASDNEVEELAKIYQNIGYIVVKTNAKQNVQVENLIPLLKNNITAMAGNSGVGKSTLLNSIFQKELTQEGNISSKNQKGKNTTTTVNLYSCGENSYLADTPGFSTFELTEIESNELDRYFVEFVQYLNKCEYGGCNHIKEENCGIKNAVHQGMIAKQRYENYQKIYQELKEKEQKRW